ncbi:ionotropic receptor 25a [Neodiprion virginianus]|uniref:ionotropic receptor 25a n=1 Tax=Neodiprion virginianus TaxID=2961670 RepID=UPI001EE697AC|nr:ionotropic receptor 25a [Neodiprion virginianus]
MIPNSWIKEWILLLLAAALLLLIIEVRGQAQGNKPQGDATPQNPSSSRPLNLLVINDEENEIANKSVTSALKELREKRTDFLLGDVTVVQINKSDARGTLDLICGVWDAAVQLGGYRIPDLVLDTTMSGPASDTVNSFTAALGLPTLSAQFGQEGDLRQWRNLKPEQTNYLVQVMPPADLVPEAIRQLVIAMNVSNAAILFDESFVMDHKYKSLLQNVPVRHVIVKSKNADKQTKDQLFRLRNLDIVNFFVLGGQKTLRATLDAAQSLNFTGRKYAWHGLTLEDFSPECNCVNISVLFLKPSPSANQQAVGELSNKGLLPKPVLTSAFYYDLTRLGVMAMRAAIDAGQWSSNVDRLTCDSYNGTNTPARNIGFLEFLKNVTSSNDFQPTYANFTWGEKNGQHQASFKMTVTLVTIADNNPVSTEDAGSWDAGIDRRLEVISEDLVANHTAQTSYRVVTVAQAPFVIYDAETDTWSGYCIDLLDEIRDIVKFEYEIRQADDQRFGNMDDEGNWNGMIKELKEKRADIALGSLSVMAERENVVDFTVPYYDLVGITILMKRPKAPTSLFKFLTVLENDVWLCILAAYFFTSFLMWVFDRWSPYSYQNNREKYKDDEEKREFNLKECLWFCMTSLTPQGGGEAPKNLSGRLVAATWWLFGFIIIASYTANLAAFLTVSRLDTPVESLDDLSKQYKIQYAPQNGSSAHTYFQRMSDIEKRFYEIWKDMSLNDSLSDVERSKLAVWDYPVSDRYTKMYQAMKEAGFPANMSEALDRVRNSKSSSEGFAFIGDATDIRYLTLTNCDLIMVGEEFSRKPLALAVQQGSPLKDQFNNAILSLLNKRKLEKLKEKWWNRNPLKVTCEKQDDQSDGISIQNIGGVFIVIFVGIGMACLTLAFEYWWYRYRPKTNNLNTLQNPKTTHSVKPVRFYLQPAAAPPRNAFDPSQFRAQF